MLSFHITAKIGIWNTSDFKLYYIMNYSVAPVHTMFSDIVATDNSKEKLYYPLDIIFQLGSNQCVFLYIVLECLILKNAICSHKTLLL